MAHSTLTMAAKYINNAEDFKQAFEETKGVLDGAKYVLMERFAEDANLVGELREFMTDRGQLTSAVVSGKEQEGAKFQDYFDHQESFARIPEHRALAMFRGRSEGILALNLLFKDGDSYSDATSVSTVGSHLGFRHQQKAADDWRAQVVSWTWKVKLSLHLESELLSTLRSRADAEAIVSLQQTYKIYYWQHPQAREPR